MPALLATNDAAVELVTCESSIELKEADVERSTRYPPSASRPGATDQTIVYVAPADAVDLAARCGAAVLTGRGPYEGQLRL